MVGGYVHAFSPDTQTHWSPPSILIGQWDLDTQRVCS